MDNVIRKNFLVITPSLGNQHQQKHHQQNANGRGLKLLYIGIGWYRTSSCHPFLLGNQRFSRWSNVCYQMFHREIHGKCTSGLLPGAGFLIWPDMSNIHNTMVTAFQENFTCMMDAVWSKPCDGKWCQTWSISGQHVLFRAEILALKKLEFNNFFKQYVFMAMWIL